MDFTVHLDGWIHGELRGVGIADRFARVTTEQIKEYLRQTPFQPFKIISAGGHGVDVPHPDYVSVGPKGRTAVVWKPNEAFSVVDLMLVTRLEFGGTAA